VCVCVCVVVSRRSMTASCGPCVTATSASLVTISTTPASASPHATRSVAGCHCVTHSTTRHSNSTPGRIAVRRNRANLCHEKTSKINETADQLIVIIIVIFCDPHTQSQGMKKLRYAIQKKYTNQAGMNLTPPPPSQNSHAVGWHSIAESERRVAEIKS